MTKKEFENLKVGDFVIALKESDHCMYERYFPNIIYKVIYISHDGGFLGTTSNWTDNRATSGWDWYNFDVAPKTKLMKVLYE